MKLEKVLKSPFRATSDLQSAFSISVADIHGNSIDLNEELLRPVVVVFAQDTCDVCGRETEMLLSHLVPDQELRVDIVTILVGTTLEDALWWEEIFGVSWRVGIDFRGRFFKQYCSENTVPCILIYDPIKGVIFRHHGEVSFEQIKHYTGPWY